MSRLAHFLGRAAFGARAAVAAATLATPSWAAVKEAAVIVLQSPGDPPVPETVISAIERAIDDTDTLAVANHDTIAQRLRRDFQDPAALESGVPEALEREAAELLETVAYGRDGETAARGRALIRRESLRLPATNRSERASHALGNVCLFVVRALLHGSNDSAAREQARECLRLIPDLAPSAAEHPPDVRTVVAAVRSGELGKLVVVPIAPGPQPCSLLIQGRSVGKLPLEIELIPGSYNLQTDCGAPGLVRRVTVRAGDNERVTVAPRLERALRLTRPSILHSGTGADALGGEELTRFADWLGLGEIWAVDRAGGALRVTRWVRTSRALVAQNKVIEAVDPTETLEPRIEAAVARTACRVAGCRDTERAQARARTFRTVGTVGAGVGIAAMLASWAAWVRYADLEREIDRGTAQPGFDNTRFTELRSDRDSFETIAVVSTGVGSALFAAGTPLALPERRGVPWWAWSVGVAGTAAAAVGTRVWIDHVEQEPTACSAGLGGCTRPKAAGPLAPMLVTQGVSLLSVPLTYVIRGWTENDAGSVGFTASPLGFGVAWMQRTGVF